MTLNTQSNATAIVKDLAVKAGAHLTASGLDTLALIAQSEFNWDAGEITGRDASGNAIPAGEWFAEKIAANGNYLSPKLTTPAESGNRTQRAIALVAASRSAENKAAQAHDLVTKFGNPWKTNNLSHQYFLKNHAPDLAAKMKAEAGK